MAYRISNYPTTTFASTALLFFGSGLAATLLLSTRVPESLIGVAIAALGLSITVWRWRRRRGARYLVQYGRPVDAVVRSVQGSGRSPYRIEAQWQDPATHEVRTFRSWSFWYDPTAFIRREHIAVYIDPLRSDRYYMDVSFLPEFDGA